MDFSLLEDLPAYWTLKVWVIKVESAIEESLDILIFLTLAFSHFSVHRFLCSGEGIMMGGGRSPSGKTCP